MGSSQRQGMGSSQRQGLLDVVRATREPRAFRRIVFRRSACAPWNVLCPLLPRQ